MMQAKTTTWLVCHGAWSAGWAWKKMRPLLHTPPQSLLHAPTMTGVGERAHLGGSHVTLNTHIEDILGVIEMEDLFGITLIGHSYGGMVATGVADRARARVAKLIYLDAFVPENGKSLYDLIGRPPSASGTDWRTPPRPSPPDTSPEDLAWVTPRRTPQPIGTLTTPLQLSGAPLPPRAYIRCLRIAPDDPMKSSADRAKEQGWPYREIDASHNPHVTAPDLLAATLKELAASIA
jgi:pimeloyl-ACP methyl ester carboxylesterase